MLRQHDTQTEVADLRCVPRRLVYILLQEHVIRVEVCSDIQHGMISGAQVRRNGALQCACWMPSPVTQ